MSQHSVRFVSVEQSRQLTELAERGRISLSRFAGGEADYDAVGLQMLDEWIERHLRRVPTPSPEIMMVWGAFLGETFRRRFSGEWGVDQREQRPELGVVCPRSEKGLIFIAVLEQVRRRVQKGMNESLAFYYTIQGVEIKAS